MLTPQKVDARLVHKYSYLIVTHLIPFGQKRAKIDLF